LGAGDPGRLLVAVAEERLGVEDPGDAAPVGGVGGDPGHVGEGGSVPPVGRGDRGEALVDAVVASDGSEASGSEAIS
jgi:hypothetical protein